MFAYELQGGFGPENLVKVERPTPEVGPDEVLVRLRAASINYRDLLVVRGQYNPRQTLPLVPLSDGVGEVVATGADVKSFDIGDRVCPIFAQAWQAGSPDAAILKSTLGSPNDGVLREFGAFHESGLVHAPANLSDIEAACLPCAAVTAWSALVTQGGVAAGDTVLLQGTGGVSTFALLFAKAIGANVIITSSSDDKLDRARILGADLTINYKETEAWGKAARKMTGGRGVDHVVEVGGAGTLTQSLKAIRPGGTISVIGVLSSAREPLNILPILMQNIRLQGVFVGHKESFVAMNRAIEHLDIHPVLDHSFPASDITQALDRMAAGAHMGKIALTL